MVRRLRQAVRRTAAATVSRGEIILQIIIPHGEYRTWSFNRELLGQSLLPTAAYIEVFCLYGFFVYDFISYSFGSIFYHCIYMVVCFECFCLIL